MDTDLKCNRLTCRKALVDKAVVTTCSHIFCVECANELFNASRLCPACETSLTEPDDVVVCSLHPSNDYKTSVLSGLSPSIILEICGRALSFWQYQIHQENSFQQALTRGLNDKNAQLQKQLENVIREANGEINLLNNKVSELERDLDLERRKVHELQEASRERDKEYQKLKVQHDKIKRKALLGPAMSGQVVTPPFGQNANSTFDRSMTNDQDKQRTSHAVGMNIGVVVGSMQANGIQRTPLVNRHSTGTFAPPPNQAWPQQHQQIQTRNQIQRQAFGAVIDHSFNTISDRSESANEVENMLSGRSRSAIQPSNRQNVPMAWGTSNSKTRALQQRFSFDPNPNAKRGFRPAR